MKQVIYNKSGKVMVKDVPVPDVGDNEVLVKNIFSVLSAGTEKSMLNLMKKPLWKMAIDRPDLAQQVIKYAKGAGVRKTMELVKSRLDVWHLLGYSSSGAVVKVGKNVKDLGVGDRVACIGSGFANHAEYVTVPKTLVAKIPKEVKLEDAAFTGIACIALQSIRQLNPQLGEKIVVVGLGLIGQMVAQMLRANGCTVIGVDIDKTKTGKEYIDQGITENSIAGVMNATNGVGADGVIIAAATKHNLVNDAFDMCRKKGRVVLLGVCGIDIDRQKMFEKELEFKISTAFGAGSFDIRYDSMGRDYPIEYARWTSERNMEAVLSLLETGKLNVDDMAENTFAIEDAEKAYKKLTDGKLITGLLSYSAKDASQTIEVNNKYVKKGKINVAFIGAGQFVKGFLIPAIKKVKDYSIYAVATKKGIDAKKLAEEIGAKYASTSYMDIIKDKNVDLIVIGTRHETHAKIAAAALKHGKNVFCEKPMAINEVEFKQLVKEIKNSDKLYTCGFNRRYSPAIKAIKQNIDTSKPMIINYTFNNKYLPEDHWVNIPEIGGGRVIGEACHVIDVFNTLTDSKPINLAAHKVASTSGEVNDDNNVSAVLKYYDGSVCNMIYTCMGNSRVERERCTVVQDGNILEMDGFGKVKKNGRIIYSGNADEGHDAEMKELARALLGKETNLADGEECIKATQTTFDIVNKTRNN